MTRMRVHELAKELNMEHKDLIDRITKMGIQVKNHMSTLTDPAVQKIRQQFAEARAESFEEKRIGRAVIRRRKRTPEEELAAAAESGEAAGSLEAPVSSMEAQLPELPEAVDRGVEEVIEEISVTGQSVEAPVDLPEARLSEEVEVQTKSEPIPGVAVEAPLSPPPATQEAITPVPAPSQPAIPVTVEPAVAEPQPAPPSPAAATPVAPPPAAPPTAAPLPPAGPPPKPVEVRVEAPVRAQIISKPDKPVPASPPPAVEPPRPVGASSVDASADEEDDEDSKNKPRRAKKRRRKKARKDEPARIIKLPEIIPEEPEEETEILQHLAPRLHVKAEDTESKEQARKRRPRTEEFEKEAAERKRRAAPRKEVFEREDLYSKKELAAQADRGRSKDRPLAFREIPKPEPAAVKVGKRRIRIDEAITVANLARQMGVKASEVIKKLLLLGLPANINQALDFDTASLLAAEFEFEVEKVGFEEEDFIQTQQDSPEDRVFRPPVVTVMGHVDHGKTSLLDAIRDTNVIGGEAGGITQHIGAYYVKLKNGDVVFLDTPGHEAFTSMRARGAKVTDLVILVVAADDGVMQQTIEAINHAKAAQVPIVVAINKIDKPNANVDRVKRELAEQGLIPEEWGGITTMVEISAKKRMGIEELLEMVLLQAEILELKANPRKPARGRVIEAKLDKGRGPVATILIQEGTLKTGDYYLCGVNSGRVRNMFSDRGQKLEAAGPATPVEVLGLSGVPNAGDDFIVLADEKQVKMVAEHRHIKLREKELTRTSKVTLESLFEQIQEGEIKELKIILKTDVHGSLEAISDSLVKLSTPEVKINLIHTATGAATETDVMLASASNAIIIGFNVRAEAKVLELAEQEHVDLRHYDIIYQVMSDVKDAMVGLLEPVFKESVMGRAEVRQTFHVPKVGMIAGCSVLDGRVERGARARVLRDQVVVYDGKISSLRRFKDDAKEVKAGFECGIGIDNFNDIKVNDVLEVYELQEMKPTLEPEAEKKAGS